MSTLHDTAQASHPATTDDRETKASSDEENSGATKPPPALTGNTTAGAGDAPAQGEHATVLRGTDVQASEAAVAGRSVGQEVAADVDTSAATKHLVRLDSTSRDLTAFQQSVESWAQSALLVLETTTNERERITVRDEAVRVAGVAAAVGAGVAVAIANDILQRAIRSIGKNTPRRRAGRPRSAASDEVARAPVGGDTPPPSPGTEGGHGPTPVDGIRSPGGTISVEGHPPAAGEEAVPHPVGGDTPPPSAGTDSGPGSTPVDGIRSPGETISVESHPPAAGEEAAPHPASGDTPPPSAGTESGPGSTPVDGIRSPGETISVEGHPPAAGEEAAPHPVGGDTTPPSETTESGPGHPPVDGIRSPGATISVGGLRSTTGDLPRATRSAYRKDAESITDPGFEGISASVRAAAAADPAAGHKLDRGLVRAAGAVEDAGGDPAELQVVEAKKRELSDARKGSAVDEGADAVPPCYVSPRIVEVVRQILDERIDLDPASTAAQNRHARARIIFDGTGTSLPGLEAAWPKDARVWVHVPRGADAAPFVQRVLTHAEAGAPVVVLTENRTHLPWAQSLLAAAAAAVCFIAGDTTVQRSRTDDPSVVEIGEAPLAAPHGHLLVGLNVDRVTFEQGCAGLGVCFSRGADQGGHAGILDALQFLPFSRKATMPAS